MQNGNYLKHDDIKLKLALFVRQLSHGSLSRQGWAETRSSCVRYPQWPRAMVLSHRDLEGSHAETSLSGATPGSQS